MYEIPIDATPSQRFLVTLDDQNCTISLYQRGQRLYCDIMVDDEELRRGAICLPRVPVIQGGTSFRGNLFFVDTRSPAMLQEPPQWRGLGDRWLLYFFDAEEMDEADTERLAVALTVRDEAVANV